MQDAKEKAMKKRSQGDACFLQSKYDEALTNFCEGLLLLPKLEMYAKEMKQLYWQRAECYLKKVINTFICRFSVQFSKP